MWSRKTASIQVNLYFINATTRQRKNSMTAVTHVLWNDSYAMRFDVLCVLTVGVHSPAVFYFQNEFGKELLSFVTAQGAMEIPS